MQELRLRCDSGQITKHHKHNKIPQLRELYCLDEQQAHGKHGVLLKVPAKD